MKCPVCGLSHENTPEHDETLPMKTITELEEKAAQFLKDHWEVNEVELTAPSGIKVKVVRITPAPIVSSWNPNWGLHFSY